MLNRLWITGFRNLSEQEIEFCGDTNVLFGDNAQGKTSVLEAVFLLSTTKSHRSRREKEILRYGAAAAAVKGIYDGGALELRITLGEKKTLSRNGVPVGRAKDWLGQAPVVMFSPDELKIVRADASVRRDFLDVALCQLRPLYMELLSEYKRLVKNKTVILKNPSYYSALPEYNRMIAERAVRIRQYREWFLTELGKHASESQRMISGDNEVLEIRYAANTRDLDEDGIYSQISRLDKEEKDSGRCLVGPHRDDFVININGRPARSFGSQGQMRTAAIALKLSERRVMERELNIAPILLLDDVLSELDDYRQNAILQQIGEGQVIITCCDNTRLTPRANGKNIHIRNGSVCDVYTNRD